LSYVPLAIHELQSDFSELRAALVFLTGGGGPAAVSLPARLPIVLLRVLGWPLTGLITAAPIPTTLAAVLVIVLATWRGWLTPATDERTATRWLGLGLLWTVIALAVGASSLATVVLGLPNDHYHAFADPIVVVLVGVGAAAFLRPGSKAAVTPAVRLAPAAIGAILLASLVGWNATHQPPASAPDGGWPAAEMAAARILVATGPGPMRLDSLPEVKSADAIRFPVERLAPGSVVSGASGSGASRTAQVILCDQLFHETIGQDCGGPAEDAAIAATVGGAAGPPTLIDRFQAASGRWVSIYRPSAAQ
jgi:hypothetical protein